MTPPPLSDPPLLGDEHVLWRGAPNWRRAARPRHPLVPIMAMLAFAAATTLAAILILAQSAGAPSQTLAGAMWAVFLLGAVTAVVVTWAKAIGQVFSLAKPQPRRDPAIYLLTTKRLIVHRGPEIETRSILRAYTLLVAILSKNGHVCDLELWFGPESLAEYWDLQDRVMLHALEDAAEVKRLILESFPAPDPERQWHARPPDKNV